MTENNVIALAGREAAGDELTELLRNGARTLIAQALEAEVAQLLERFQDHRDEMGRARVVRNGHLSERNIQTGIGPVTVKIPKVRTACNINMLSIKLSPDFTGTVDLEILCPDSLDFRLEPSITP